MTDHARAIEAGARADLLPCPFCGGEGLIYQSQNAAALWRVCCKNCDAGPHSHIGLKEAVKRWNTRAIASGALVPAKSAPVCKASHNSGERDPSVMPDWPGADTAARLSIARAICRSDNGPGVPSCVMDAHPEREPCNETNCRRFEQADAVIRALDTAPASGDYVVVPRVPTRAMIDEATGSATGDGVPDEDYDDDVRRIWTAMLDAASRTGGGK